MNITIDTDKDPLIPYDTWKVEEHKKSGIIEWKPETMELYLSGKQKDSFIRGHDLRKELGDNVMNANVLDFLLDNPKLIPKEWQKDAKGNVVWVYFWGTIYRDSDGDLCVRCLYFYEGHWQASYRWLGGVWVSFDPALRRALYISEKNDKIDECKLKIIQTDSTVSSEELKVGAIIKITTVTQIMVVEE